jgi:hypothetical protein
LGSKIARDGGMLETVRILLKGSKVGGPSEEGTHYAYFINDQYDELREVFFRTVFPSFLTIWAMANFFASGTFKAGWCKLPKEGIHLLSQAQGFDAFFTSKSWGVLH